MPAPETWRIEALESLEQRLTNLIDDKHERTNQRIDRQEITLAAWSTQARADFVTRGEFTARLETIQERYAPVVRIVYGLVAAIGLAVLGAALSLVVKR